MKAATPWNNQSKPASTWTPVNRQSSAWANNIQKAQTLFQAIGRVAGSWGPNTPDLFGWMYNDENYTFNDERLAFNYVENHNQVYQRQVTIWSPA